MNNLEITSYIDAKKKSRIYIENEIRASQEILDDMKAQKPVKWYNNLYYILKRFIFLFLAIISLLFLISTFINKHGFQNYFENHYSNLIKEYLNENFGSKSEIIITKTSAVEKKIIATKVSIHEIRKDLREKLTNQVFEYTFAAFQIALVFFTILFWYVARLTRQLHLKNKLILNHYEVNVKLMNLYSDVIKEQNYEISFLEKATRR